MKQDMLEGYNEAQRRSIEAMARRKGCEPTRIVTDLIREGWAYFDGNELKEAGMVALRPEAAAEACRTGRYTEADVMQRFTNQPEEER